MADTTRQPPHFVPTLTDVVDRRATLPPEPQRVPVPTPTRAAGPFVPEAAPPTLDAEQWQKVVDAVTDRVMQSLKCRLHEALTDELELWAQRQVPVLADRVAQSLLDELADACRQAVDEAAAGTGRQPGNHGPSGA